MGIYSLYTLGLGTGGPRYIWTIPVVVGLMMLVALVFGELASEYPLSGALYQYGKYSVGSRYGWFIGWIYGFALLATVASVDSGAVGYVTALTNIWFGTKWDPANHLTIFGITGAIIVLSAILNWIGAKIMGRVARFGVYVETIGTFGVFVALAFFGFHQDFGFIFTSRTSSTSRATRSASTLAEVGGRGRSRRRSRERLHLLRIRIGRRHLGRDDRSAAPSSPSDAQRAALRWHRVVRPGARLAARHARGGIGAVVNGGINVVLGVLPGWLQTFFLVMVIVAFFSCGTAVQGAGARVAFALARDGALPFSEQIRAVSPRHHTPANAILVGTIVPFLFSLLVLVNPSKPVHLLWFDYPAHVNALYALVSFATSGIYLAFLLTVLGALVARRADGNRAESSRSASGESRSRSAARSTCCSCLSTSSGRARCRAAAPSLTTAG